jgi:hypothetical protein
MIKKELPLRPGLKEELRARWARLQEAPPRLADADKGTQ